MSYLDVPRLHFIGQFRADPSTVNNDPSQYAKAETDPPDYTKIGEWNPFGTGIWQPVNCIVTRAIGGDGAVASSSSDDVVVGMSVFDADARAPGKIVDLDPQQQMCSALWGLQVRVGRSDAFAFSGEFSVAAFVDIWPRVVGPPTGFTSLGACWQSVLTGISWGELGGSKFLAELKAACLDGLLSIKFNVDGFEGKNVGRSATFGLGRLCGTIGVTHRQEPERFIAGRHLAPVTGPKIRVKHAPATVSRDRGKIILDLGNSIQSTHPGGPLAKIPPLLIGLGGAGSPFRALGTIDTSDPAWYGGTAGVCEVPADRRLTAEELTALDSDAIALAVASDAGTPTILAREQVEGVYVRADQFVFRQSPGETIEVTLRASKFGAPLANAPVNAKIDAALLKPDPGDPPVCVPPTASAFPAQIRTDASGIAKLRIAFSDPRLANGAAPRDGIDGQVYAIGYELADAKEPTGTRFNGSDFLSILLWNNYPIPANPTWNEHVEPIFRQYAYLYPVMKTIVDLGDYNSVVKSQFKLAVVFALPVENPNYMPVTRDLSPAKRNTILNWLGPPGSPVPPARGGTQDPASTLPADLREMKSGR